MTKTELLEARRNVELAHDDGDLTDAEYSLALAIIEKVEPDG